MRLDGRVAIVIAAAGGSVGKLAAMVGMERTHLYRKLKDLGVDPKTAGCGGLRQGSMELLPRLRVLSRSSSLFNTSSPPRAGGVFLPCG